jgi:hypothetical protein
MGRTKAIADKTCLCEGTSVVVDVSVAQPKRIDTCTGGWPRYDPCLGLWLCSNCWNNGPMGLKHRCTLGLCDCPCTDMRPPVKRRFTGEGQLSIDMSNPLIITAKS